MLHLSKLIETTIELLKSKLQYGDLTTDCKAVIFADSKLVNFVYLYIVNM